MFQMSRRKLISGLLASTALPLSGPAFAQSALTDEQRKDFARQFAAGGASSQERLILQDIQDSRIAFPSSNANLKAFIEALPSTKAMTAGTTPELGMLLMWSGYALQATSSDHTTDNSANPPPTFAEQLGPCRTSRAMAIVHLAMFEAVNTIYRRFKSYKDTQTKILAAVGVPKDQITDKTASVKRAIIEAAYNTLVDLYPAQQPIFKLERETSLVTVGDNEAAITVGERIGTSAAKLILDMRRFDGSQRPDLTAGDFASNSPLDWHQDPISLLAPALGGNWSRVQPFVITSSEKYRPAPPPTVDAPQFIDAFKEIKKLGGDPNAPTAVPRWPTPTMRTGADLKGTLDDNNQTFKGIFWAYDGTPQLCAPPRLYNMVATRIALNEKAITKVDEFARFLALMNVAMADAAISAWEAKYHYAYARPITAIRAISVDNTAEGKQDPNWTPLGAPVSNGKIGARNLTPPFPSYPSGHAVFGGALFQAMRKYWQMPETGVPFDFVSDEYNGLNRQPGDQDARPNVPRHFAGFDVAEKENAYSRLWLGIHWKFDADEGIKQRRQIADDVMANILGPV
jgi:hypothetical protein